MKQITKTSLTMIAIMLGDVLTCFTNVEAARAVCAPQPCTLDRPYMDIAKGLRTRVSSARSETRACQTAH